MPSFDSLPQEIVDRFVDELAISFKTDSTRNNESLREDLLSCMQASRSLRSRSRHLFFSELTLTVQSMQVDPKSSRTLREVLEDDRRLAQQVRSLTIDIKSRYTSRMEIRDVHLPAILGLVPCLHELALVCADGATGWHHFDNDIMIAMFKLHDLPLLRTLELCGNLSTPIDFVSRWTNLKNLTIRGSPLRDPRNVIPPVVVPKSIKEREMAQLKSLQLLSNFANSACLLDEEDNIILHHLDQITVELYTQQDRTFLWSVMSSAWATVQTLTIYNVYCGGGGSSLSGLRQITFQHLRSVEIQEGRLLVGEHHVRDVSRLLSTHFTSSPKIETILISLTWRWPRTRRAIPIQSFISDKRIIMEDSWYLLDRSLAAARGLKSLDISTRYVYESEELATKLKDFYANAFERWTPERAFPLLSSNGDSIVRLTVTHSTES